MTTDRRLWCERNESSASAHGHTDDCYRDAPAKPSPAAREAPCSRCGSDWHYTDECLALPVGAYVASALMAANIACDSGEDVDRFLDELATRGYRVALAESRP